MIMIHKKILEVSAIFFVITGLLLYLYFMYAWYNVDQSFNDWLGHLANIGQSIDGMVSSIWAFASTLLILVTLRLQREDLEKQREEFRANLVFTIVNQQIQRIDDAFRHFKIKIKDIDYVGRISFTKIKEMATPYSGHVEMWDVIGDCTWEQIKPSKDEQVEALKSRIVSYVNFIIQNDVALLSFIQVLYSTLKIVEFSLSKKENQNLENIDILKAVYIDHIGSEVFSTIETFYKVMHFYSVMKQNKIILDNHTEVSALFVIDTYLYSILQLGQKIQD